MALRNDVILRPHQESAVDKAVRTNGNLVFAHPVGSGKTVTGLAAFEKLKSLGKANRALVVTPASLRENFAEKGVDKFTTDDYVIYGNKQESDDPRQTKTVSPESVLGKSNTPTYGIVSYDMFRKDPSAYLKAHEADTVIFDEIHKIRNDASQTFAALKAHRGEFKNFIGMTGSVANNSPADIVPLVDAMTDGKHRLGTKASFHDRFVTKGKSGVLELRNQHVVQALTTPYIHYVSKEEIEKSNDKPPLKVVSTIEVPMSDEQANLYRLVIDKLDPITQAKLRMNMGKLSDTELRGIYSKLMKTRQLTNSMAAMDANMSLSESARQTPKIRQVLDDVEDHLQRTSDGQVVIHSNLLQGGLDVIEQGLIDRGMAYGKFIGKGNKGVTERSRQQSIRDFNSGNLKTLLISSAGGEGLDLPNTTMFASLDGHFNPEKINQAEARGVRAGGQAHRAEKDRKVIVNRYVSTLPMSKVNTAGKVWESVKPTTYLSRYIKGQPILQNPFSKDPSVDEIIYQVAANKDNANAQLRGLLDKKASFLKLAEIAKKRTKAEVDNELIQLSPYNSSGYYSDSKILDQYHKQFGERLLANDFPEDGFINEKAERAHLADLRDYYRTMSQPGLNVIRVDKKDAKKYENADSRKALLWLKLKDAAKATGVTGAIALPIAAGLGYVSKHTMYPSTSRQAARHALQLAALPAFVGAAGIIDAATNSKRPHTMTTAAQAKRRSKLKEEDLLRLLRGQVVTTEKVQRKDDYI